MPLIVQWDDHETVNNWYPLEQLDADDRYTVKSVALLSARAREGVHGVHADRLIRRFERIYRHIPYGPSWTYSPSTCAAIEVQFRKPAIESRSFDRFSRELHNNSAG
ncbi:MAG: alkaline phosphatase D family protein [Candidatus Competibacteraceae bacterium]